MARTFPTAGVSPIDAYVTTEVPAAHIEHALTATLDSALATMKIVTACNLVAGGIIQGLNVTTTLGSSSASGTTACAVYAKLDLGTGIKSVSGRASVIEGRLDIGIAESLLSTMSMLCLDFDNDNVYQTIGNVKASYIALRDRSATVGLNQMNNIFDFMDITPSTGNNSHLFCSDATGSAANTHTLRFMVGTTPYWLMVTSAAPTA